MRFALLKGKGTNFQRSLAWSLQVTYDKALWRGLSNQLRQGPLVFITKDRMSILHHAFVSARTGYLSYADLFLMIEFVKKETEYITVTTALSGLGYMSSILRCVFDNVFCALLWQSYVATFCEVKHCTSYVCCRHTPSRNCAFFKPYCQNLYLRSEIRIYEVHLAFT